MNSVDQFRRAHYIAMESAPRNSLASVHRHLLNGFKSCELFTPSTDVQVARAELNERGFIYYVSVPERNQILMYCPVVNQIIDLTKVSFAPKRLATCHKYLLSRLSSDDRQPIEDFINNTTLKYNVNRLMRFVPTVPVARQLLIDIIEYNYKDSFIRDSF